MKKLRCTIAALLLMVFLPSVTLAAPAEPFQEHNSSDNELHSGEAQVAFFAGDACGGLCYVNQLKIQGHNQHDTHTTWLSDWYSAPEYSFALYNWWWKPARHIRLDFHIEGYGWRSCSVYDDRAENTWIHITYKGNYQCTYTYSPSRW